MKRLLALLITFAAAGNAGAEICHHSYQYGKPWSEGAGTFTKLRSATCDSDLNLQLVGVDKPLASYSVSVYADDAKACATASWNLNSIVRRTKVTLVVEKLYNVLKNDYHYKYYWYTGSCSGYQKAYTETREKVRGKDKMRIVENVPGIQYLTESRPKAKLASLNKK